MKQFLFAIGVVGVFFSFLQFSNPSLIGDDDVYWHIRYSENILTVEHLTRDFFGDPIPYAGVLFHLILAPFTLISNIFVAQKVAGIFFVCFITALTFLIVKKINIRNPAIWTIVIFFISVNFSFRIILVRTFLMSIILLLLGIYSLLLKKRWALYAVAIAYGLSYSIPFLLAVGIIWTISQIIVQGKKGVDWMAPVIILGGILTGIVLHPVFPQNIIFLKDYLLPVFYKVPIEELNGGVELAPYGLFQFIQYEWMALFLWVTSVFLFIKNYFKTEAKSKKLFFVLVSAMFFGLALMSRRFIEYSTLFMGISAISVLQPYINKLDGKTFLRQFAGLWQMKVAAILLASILLIGVSINISTIYTWASSSEQIESYSESGKWISVNIPKGSRVLNSDWGLYPKLYFYNSSADYIAQFDPAYLYLKNNDLYSKWVLIANDSLEIWPTPRELHQTIVNDFEADYLILKTEQNIKLKDFLENPSFSKGFFDKVYEDQELTVYKIP